MVATFIFLPSCCKDTLKFPVHFQELQNISLILSYTWAISKVETHTTEELPFSLLSRFSYNTILNFIFGFPCIRSLYYIKNQHDANLAVLFINTFTAIVELSRFNNSCLKSPASTLVDLTFQSRMLRSFSLNQLRNLSL